MRIDDKVQIGNTLCRVSTHNGLYFLSNLTKISGSFYNADILRQFSIKPSELSSLSNITINTLSGDFPYHNTLADLEKTVKVLQCISTLSMRGDWRDSVVKWNKGPLDNKTDFVIGESKYYNNLLHYGECTRARFTRGELEYVYKKPIISKEIHFKIGDKLIGKARSGAIIESIPSALGEKGKYYVCEKIEQMTFDENPIVRLWENGGFWECFVADIKIYEEPTENVFDHAAIKAQIEKIKASPMDVVDSFGVCTLGRVSSNTPFDFLDISAWDTKSATSFDFRVLRPLAPSEAFKVKKNKIVLLSPIKIKKRPLI
jgi:hypothetical protein